MHLVEEGVQDRAARYDGPCGSVWKRDGSDGDRQRGSRRHLLAPNYVASRTSATRDGIHQRSPDEDRCRKRRPGSLAPQRHIGHRRSHRARCCCCCCCLHPEWPHRRRLVESMRTGGKAASRHLGRTVPAVEGPPDRGHRPATGVGSISGGLGCGWVNLRVRAMAEADGNRTRQRRMPPLTGVEDRGAHQEHVRLPRPRTGRGSQHVRRRREARHGDSAG